MSASKWVATSPWIWGTKNMEKCAFSHHHEAVNFLDGLWYLLPYQWRFWGANETDMSTSASVCKKCLISNLKKKSTSYELVVSLLQNQREIQT